jgi:hypothetical protein
MQSEALEPGGNYVYRPFEQEVKLHFLFMVFL